MVLHPFSAVPTGFQELVNGESEESVALAADAQVAVGGNAVGPFLPHDVHESPPAPELAGADTFDIQRHLGFVVEAGVPFVAVQRQFILLGDLPDRNGDRASLLRLDREIGAGLAALEQEPVVLQFRGANDPRPRAAPAHLLDIEVAPVGNVVSFHSVILPFRGASPFYHRKPASAGSGASGRRPSSGGSAVAEGCVTGKAAGQDSYWGHHHLTCQNSRNVCVQFCDEINRIFQKTGLLYHLNTDLQVERIVENSPLTPAVESAIAAVSEPGTRELLQEAILLHRSPYPADIRNAVEKLWDAYERLKTYYTTMNKRDSAAKIVSDISGGQADYITLFDTEFQALTKIGNNFRIRHHETDKVEITDVRHYDYFFNRCLSLIALAIQYLQ